MKIKDFFRTVSELSLKYPTYVDLPKEKTLIDLKLAKPNVITIKKFVTVNEDKKNG